MDKLLEENIVECPYKYVSPFYNLEFSDGHIAVHNEDCIFQRSLQVRLSYGRSSSQRDVSGNVHKTVSKNLLFKSWWTPALPLFLFFFLLSHLGKGYIRTVQPHGGGAESGK